MDLGPNIKRAGVWMVAFLVAQGMVYRFGYEQGYLFGHRQGYGDVIVEAGNRQWDEEVRRGEWAQSDEPLPDRSFFGMHAVPGR